MGPIRGYCKRCQKKPTAIMETICGYWNKGRTSTIICALYAGITRNAKWQWLLWDSYAGIARNVKGQRLLRDLYAGIAKYKMHVAILGVICRYCILENGLTEFTIENDAGIICLKCVGYFKSLQAM